FNSNPKDCANMRAALLLLFVSSLAWAQPFTKPFRVYEEGNFVGSGGINFVGQGMVCTPDPLVAKCTTSQSPLRIDDIPGVDCSGNTDSSTALQTYLNNLNGVGAAIILPSKCIIRLPQPSPSNNPNCTANGVPWPCCTGNILGTCNGPSLAIPSNVHFKCV